MAELNGTPATVADVQALALTNYGHFTSMLVENGRARGLALHLQRLVRDCQRLFGTELDTVHVRELVRHTIRDRSAAVVVRITVFDPELTLANPGASAAPKILITTRPAPSAPSTPLRLTTARHERDLPEVKHVGLFTTLVHRRAAQQAGFDDVLFVGHDGAISEGATWNIGFLRDGRIVWPAAPSLPGVTQALIVAAGVPATTAPITTADLPSMQAAFATNAGVGVRPVTAIDEVTWSPSPDLDALRKLYLDLPGELV